MEFPRVFWVESEFRLALLKAESAYVHQLIEEIRDDTLGGSAFWRQAWKHFAGAGHHAGRAAQGPGQVLRDGVRLDEGGPAGSAVRYGPRPTVRQHQGQGPQFLESVRRPGTQGAPIRIARPDRLPITPRESPLCNACPGSGRPGQDVPGRPKKPALRALDGLTFSVPEGVVLGLLGPNGAGKSTTVKILTTLSRADSGTARVAGYDVVRSAGPGPALDRLRPAEVQLGPDGDRGREPRAQRPDLRPVPVASSCGGRPNCWSGST